MKFDEVINMHLNTQFYGKRHIVELCNSSMAAKKYFYFPPVLLLLKALNQAGLRHKSFDQTFVLRLLTRMESSAMVKVTSCTQGNTKNIECTFKVSMYTKYVLPKWPTCCI